MQIQQKVPTNNQMPNYFHILLCELRIYFDLIRADCWKKNQDCVGEFYIVHVQFEWSVFEDELTRRLSSS